MKQLEIKDKGKIILSSYTLSLINSLKSIKTTRNLDEFSKIYVSQTVSFFALVYEKVRNAIEYHEDHLLRRAAIERIIRRRLMMNPKGEGEAENLIRELLWARYFPNGSLTKTDAERVQKIIDNFLFLREISLEGRPERERIYLAKFLFDILTCEIEETLSETEAQKKSRWIFFVFKVLHQKIKIEGISDKEKDLYFYTAVEKGYGKSDKTYLRYHLFALTNKRLRDYSKEELEALASSLLLKFGKIDAIINNPFKDKLLKFVKKQAPSFLILQEIMEKNLDKIEEILTDRKKLWQQVDIVCRKKYKKTKSRLISTAVRSLIYIFLTKMLLAIILEYPLSLYFYNEVNYQSIAINTVFPPLLMLGIVLFVKVPGEKNTRKIFHRLVDIINKDKEFETSIALISKKPKKKKPILIFGFTLFYSLTFIITLSLIHYVLKLLHFNLISELIFIFFVSVVTFFAYRVRQISKEYKLEDKESFFSPFIDFFFMPILSIGKFLSKEVSQFNFLTFFFDFFLEAPFKLIFEIFEEWISFVKKKKEEII